MSVSVHLIHGSGQSVRDKYGWLSIEGANVPYILRESKEKFIPVRIIEKYILQYYPSTYPKSIQERPPLVCHYMKGDELSLLNKCCRQQASSEHFIKTDPVVKLSDFLEFFGLVKEAYPNVVIGGKVAPVVGSEVQAVSRHKDPDYGWMLLKDALVPYVLRGQMRLAPLNVIRGAAQLLIGIQVENACAIDAEVTCLNEMCRKVGLVFTFQKNTALANLKTVMKLCPGCPIQDLPKENPMDSVNMPQETPDVLVTPKQTVVNASASYRSPPPLKPLGVARKAVVSEQQSATRSLQFLAQMAREKDQGPLSDMPDEDDCVLIDDGVDQTTAKSRARSSSKSSSKSSLSPTNRSVCSSPGSTASENRHGRQHSSVAIKPMDCLGKTISCLLRGKSGIAYALVEAVCRVYFPSCSLVDFIHFLELDLAVTLYVLKKAEEEAFIEFYGIPTKQLRCNQVIKLQDLRDRMSWLQKRFGTADDSVITDVGQGSKSKGSSLSEISPVFRDEALQEPRENGSLLSMATSDVLATCGLTEMNLSQAELAELNTDVTPKNKNLEHTIMRIMHDKQENGDDANKRTGKDNFDASDSEYYPELEKHTPDSIENGASEKKPACSSNKRKGVPPRRCLAPPQKKITMLVDGIKIESKDQFTEDSDMDDYV